MKLLVLSHNPITTYHNMGKTLLSLLSGFSKDELCQIYIYPTLPDIAACDGYYRVTDKDILRSLLTLSKPGEEIPVGKISKEHSMYEKAEDEAVYTNVKNKTTHRRILREIMWKASFWFNGKMKSFLDKQKPDCIFVAPGDGMFLYDIALKIADYCNIPIVSYICDEYYFVSQPENSVERFRIRLLRKKISALMEKTALLIAISEEIRQQYCEHFGIEGLTVMTGADDSLTPVVPENEGRVMSYFGNIRCNRYISIAKIGKTLDSLNEGDGKERILNIYTSEKDEKILGEFDGIRSVNLCGFVTGEEFKKALLSSDVLLHTEAFDKENAELVRHSVSTKIADSLYSGVPLFAFGPDYVSSMLHLKRNDCAATVTDENELAEMLFKIFSDGELRKSLSAKGRETADKFHNRDHNSSILYKAITKTAQKQEENYESFAT